MREIRLPTREIHEKLGHQCGSAVNLFFSGEPLGQYKLKLPAALAIDFSHLDGFSPEETNRYLKSALATGMDESEEDEGKQEEEFSEAEEERGVGYWQQKINQFQSEGEALAKTVITREEALQDAKKKQTENVTKLAHAQEMLKFAKEKLEILPLDGTVSQKIEKLKVFKDVARTLFDSNLSIEGKVKEFVEILNESHHVIPNSKKRNAAPAAGDEDGILFFLLVYNNFYSFDDFLQSACAADGD